MRAGLYAAVGAVIVALILSLLLPARIKGSVLIITLAGTPAGGAAATGPALLISNASPYVVIYDNGPPLVIATLTATAWLTNYNGSAPTGKTILKPGCTQGPVAVNVQLAPGPSSSTLVAGLPFTALSWRGRLAISISSKHLLRPLARLLFAVDVARRSGFAWSDALPMVEKPEPRSSAPGHPRGHYAKVPPVAVILILTACTPFQRL
jgi:hypothetical protein